MKKFASLVCTYLLLAFIACKKDNEQPAYKFVIEFDGQTYQRHYASTFVNATTTPPNEDRPWPIISVGADHQTNGDTLGFQARILMKKFSVTPLQATEASFYFYGMDVACRFSDTTQGTSMNVVVDHITPGTYEAPGIISGTFSGVIYARAIDEFQEELKPIEGSFTLPHFVFPE